MTGSAQWRAVRAHMRTTRRIVAGWVMPLTLLCMATLAGCGRTDAERAAIERQRATGYRGLVLPEPLPPIDFSLTDTDGEPFRFRERTAGQLTLLFFGYTSCPDICPVHMANLAAVLEDLPYSTRRSIEVVFVTTDPERDSPERLADWLGRFDTSFIGVLGPLDDVNAIQAELKLPAAVRGGHIPGREDDPRGYAVGHASQVIAIDPEGRAIAYYPSGTRQTDWIHDLPRWVDETGAGARRGGPEAMAAGSFEDVLRTHLARYPAMELADLYKLVHQAAMGNEHRIDDTAAVRRRLEQEVAALEPWTGEPRTEPLRDPLSPDGALVRVNLRPFRADGGSPDALTTAFVRTAERWPGSVERLVEHWVAARSMARSGELPFDLEEMSRFLAAREVEGFPAVHHSPAYESAYRPAYRVVAVEHLEPR